MFLDVGASSRLWFDPNNGPFPYPDDAYPAVMYDQRHMYGVSTVVEVEHAWAERLGHTPIADSREVIPYINRGIWFANCPDCRPNDAPWGLVAWDENPRVCCDRCGRTFKVAWQLPKERSDAVRLLAVRERVNQNWNAHEGETVDRLVTENLLLLGIGTVVKNGIRMPASLRPADAVTSKQNFVDRII